MPLDGRGNTWRRWFFEAMGKATIQLRRKGSWSDAEQIHASGVHASARQSAVSASDLLPHSLYAAMMLRTVEDTSQRATKTTRTHRRKSSRSIVSCAEKKMNSLAARRQERIMFPAASLPILS